MNPDSNQQFLKMLEFEKFALLTGHVRFLSFRGDDGITHIFQESLTTYARMKTVATPQRPNVRNLPCQSSRITRKVYE